MPKIDTLESGSSSQRDWLNHQAVEDYLKTIYTLAEIETPVSTSRIAEARDVKPGSVTNMLQRLDRLNLVHYEKHYGVTLTKSGQKIALEVIRHHRLLELYLMEALGFSWDEVHEQADILEHVISEKLEDRIAAVLGNPRFDPHGAPIPTKEGAVVPVESQPLTKMAPGRQGTITQVLDDDNSEMLRYLADLGLVPGASFLILSMDPFDGPITLEVNGKQKIIGHKIAALVLVTTTP